MDARIADYLAGLGADGTSLALTHQEIAAELGTAREVVSRVLKDLERARLVALGRAQVTILDRAGLQAWSSAR